MPHSKDSRLTRRQFGVLAGAAGLSLGLQPWDARLAWAADEPNAASIIKGKKAELIVHNAKLGVLETPISLLRQHAHTPKDILFTRLHFPHEGKAEWYATTEAPKQNDWAVRIDGLVERPRIVALADLAKMGQAKRVSVIQCAGNGRSYYAAKQKVAGGQWKNGGMGNVEWEGVPLREFLAEMKLGISPVATWLTAGGWDEPPTPEGSDFAKSYQLSDPGLDNAIIALKMNGEPIPAVHGGPVRLLIPGFYGNMSVKFLTTLLLAAHQSPSAYQSVGYRMPLQLPSDPAKFKANDYNLTNSLPTYGHQIKSVIFAPLTEDKPKPGDVEVTGIAFNDGMARITNVTVSTDGGASWTEAQLQPPESPWAWHHWKAKGKLKAGANTIMARATDALGRSQPLDGLDRWNPRGYEWNGVERLEVSV